MIMQGNKPEFIIIHHTATPLDTSPRTFFAVKQYHINKGWGDIGYHYFIENNGMLYKGRDDSKEGAHCYQEDMNKKSIGVCLEGNFDIELPTTEQEKVLKDLILNLRIKYNIPRQRIMFHRDFALYKTCPGNNFTWEYLQKLIMLKEVIRNSDNGAIYFTKGGKKQKISSVEGIMTVLTREFGVRNVDTKYVNKLPQGKFF